MKTLFVDYLVHGTITAGEVALPITDRDLKLPCGIYGRWQRND